jgi:hypothetical protein
MSKKAYIQEAEEVKRLKDEVREKGTDREKNILHCLTLNTSAGLITPTKTSHHY